MPLKATLAFEVIETSGSATRFQDLTDVHLTSPFQDSIPITYDTATSKFTQKAILAAGVSDFASAADARIAAAAGVSIATLVGGFVPISQIAGSVARLLTFANIAAFPGTGVTNDTIYVALDTNRTYRWTGSSYVETSPSAVTTVNGKSNAVSLTTNDIPEDTNLYYTNTRVLAIANVVKYDGTAPFTASQAFNAGMTGTGATFSGTVTAAATKTANSTMYLGSAQSKPIRFIQSVDATPDTGGGLLTLRTLDVDSEDALANLSVSELYCEEITIGDESYSAPISVDSDNHQLNFGAGAQFTGTVQVSEDLLVNGNASAASFAGDGSALTNLPAPPVPYTYATSYTEVPNSDGIAFDVSAITATTHLLIGDEILGSTPTITFTGTWASTVIGAPFTLILAIDAGAVTFDISSSLFVLPSGMSNSITVSDVAGPSVLIGFMWTVPDSGVFVFAVTQLVTDIALTTGG